MNYSLNCDVKSDGVSENDKSVKLSIKNVSDSSANRFQ